MALDRSRVLKSKAPPGKPAGPATFGFANPAVARYTSGMIRFLCVVLALCVTIPVSTDAMAGCTDPAAPEVNWRRCYHDSRDLTGVDLSGAQLRDATFQRSHLDDGNLDGIDGFRAKFISATMTGVTLEGARLFEADLTKADLTGANLQDTDLRNAKLVNAILRGANLSGARLAGADLRNADLSGAMWVDGIRICADGSLGQCH